jgi:FAD/FMN-containing dehydrogenase
MNNSLSTDLARLVGSGGVSTDQEQINRYSGDALGVYRAFRAAHLLDGKASAVVWPESTEHVSAILKYAQSHPVPVVPYGGGTGVMGAAAPVDECIILNLQRMNAVVDVSSKDMTARLQPGVVLEDAYTAFAEQNLLMGHDPWSRPIATIGGAISTNGMGYMAAKYGSMGEQVLGLEAVLPDGEIVRAQGIPKPSYGLSIKNLLIGTEGTLGVVTEATLRAFPVPEKQVLRRIDFPDFETGFNAVAQLYAEGVRPAVVDYGEEFWPDNDADERVPLYLAFQGFLEDVDAHLKRAQEICQRFGGRPGDQNDAKEYWETRHASGKRYLSEVLQSDDPAKARRNRSSYRMDYLHVALPTSQVLDYRKRCQDIFHETNVIVREWSLWARPEFFSFIIMREDDAATDSSTTDMADVVDQVLRLAQQMGGSMEYCHGVGLKLAHLMGGEQGAGLKAAQAIKKALDPNLILNPGKLMG